MSDTAATPRPLSAIAAQISADWKNVNYGAVPYLEAMASLGQITDKFGLDDGNDIVRRFLINAGAWRGETARAVKAELRQMAGIK